MEKVYTCFLHPNTVTRSLPQIALKTNVFFTTDPDVIFTKLVIIMDYFYKAKCI